MFDNTLSKKNNVQFILENSEDGVDKSTDDESSDGRYFCTQYPNDTSKDGICGGDHIDTTTICGKNNEKSYFVHFYNDDVSQDTI